MQIIDWILGAIGSFLAWIDSWTGNYLFAILIFAFIIELLMLPFGIKQQKNSIRQAKLRPKEMAIRRKYAGRNDQATQQKITQEIQELYQKEHFSPFAGCLPMLIQLPIILIIYNVVINPLSHVVHLTSDQISAITTHIQSVETEEIFKSIEHSQIALSNFIESKGPEYLSNIEGFTSLLSEGDTALDVFNRLPDTSVFGLNLSLTPTISASNNLAGWLLLIVPVLTFVVYFFSMKLTRKFSYQPNMAADDKQAACSNRMMEWMMPLMSLWISFTVPALIGVYWIFKSILGTLKQFILSKAMPLPVYTEEDIMAAERELKGKAPAQEPREVSGGPVRSLHYEDADEEGPYPTFVGKKSSFDEVKTPEKEEEPVIDEADLKEDEKDSENDGKND